MRDQTPPPRAADIAGAHADSSLYILDEAKRLMDFATNGMRAQEAVDALIGESSDSADDGLRPLLDRLNAASRAARNASHHFPADALAEAVTVIQGYHAEVANLRQRVAAEIRNEAAMIADQVEARAGVVSGKADTHPFILGAEFAAQIAEGLEG